MNLLTKTTLYYVTVSLFVFFIGGIGMYKLIKTLEENKVKKELNNHKLRLLYSIEHHEIRPSDISAASGGLISFIKVDSLSNNVDHYIDTLIVDKLSNSIVSFKCLSFGTTINKIDYRAFIYKPMTELNFLVEQIALIVTIITIFFLLAVYFLYRYFFARIWSDFFDTIHKIQDFNLSSPEPMKFSQSMIIEFNELNDVLKKMIDRINADFQALREFSGNLSHEIQTPLAVIKSKASLLIQDENINENQMILAGNITRETNRISSFIKALALFSKLEYAQFPNPETIDVELIVHRNLAIFEDFIDNKQIRVNVRANSKLNIKMNKELANILFTNLIKNAVRHNLQQGKIDINISSNSFTISNTGNELSYDANLLFNRFLKHKPNSESLGIGLSIVKKICDYYKFSIQYINIERLHTITLKF